MSLHKGKYVILDKICKVKIIWHNDTLMQVEYNDMTRRLLKISKYKIDPL